MNENSSREQAFARSLERVCRTAREQGGCISREQVKEEFGDGFGDLSGEQLGMIYDYLEKRGIGVDRPLPQEEFLTEEENRYLQSYLEELAAIPVRSPGEIEAYCIRALAGEGDGGRKLMEQCLRDVADIAKLYVGQGVCLEDLIGEGNVALAAGIGMLGSMKEAGAVCKPSDVQGALARLVMDAMENHILENAENRRTDKKAADRVNQVADKARELSEQLRRKVTPEELSEETGMSLNTIQAAMRMSGYKIEDIDWASGGADRSESTDAADGV